MVLVLTPFTANANAALPFVTPLARATIAIPGFLLLGFIPIVIIEAFVVKRILKHDSLKLSFAALAVGNLVSTAAGLIVSLFVRPALSIMNPDPNSPAAYFPDFFISALIVLIAGFYVSVLLEYLVARKFFKNIDKKEVKKAIWKANLVSYVLLAIAVLAIYFSIPIS